MDQLSATNTTRVDPELEVETEVGIERACWSLIKFDLPEFPFERKTISIANMIMEIEKMAKGFKQCDNIPDKDNIIVWFEILYVLQINEKSEVLSIDQMEAIITSVASTESNEDCKNNIAMRNLYRALNHLKKIVQMEEEEENHGLIELDSFILETHKIILDKISEQGGIFSTKERVGIVDTCNKTFHTYPKFETVECVRRMMQRVIDEYNPLYEAIKKLYSEESKSATEKLYKLSGLLPCKIMYYHPFGDGNGRLARLLGSYALSLTNPFPTPIYGLFSPSTRVEYVDTLIEARTNVDIPIPSALTALIIESSYYGWKMFIKVVEMAKAGENWKSVLVQYARKAEK